MLFQDARKTFDRSHVGAGHARDISMDRGHGPLLQECDYASAAWVAATMYVSTKGR